MISGSHPTGDLDVDRALIQVCIGDQLANDLLPIILAMRIADPHLRQAALQSGQMRLQLKRLRTIIVRINDRGPFHDNRIIDLSYTAAVQLGIVSRGTGYVEVRAIDPSVSPIAIAQTAATDTQATPSEQTAVQGSQSELKIFVQVGAFGVLANAQGLAQRLQAFKIGDVQVHKFTVAERDIHKVWIGPLNDVAEADVTVNKLNEIQHQDYKIVFSEPF